MITVCIATYNGSRYIRQQLLSILPQLAETDEIVVSDDGSTDDTSEIVRSIGDKRIRIVDNRKGEGGKHYHTEKDGKHYHKEEGGKNALSNSLTQNFENALRHAKGDYIFLSDQDDVWMENKVAVCMEVLRSHHCVVSDAIVTDKDLNDTNDSFYKMIKMKPGRLYNLLWHNGYTGCCMAFRRDVMQKALPFPADIPMHDIWIGNVAAFFFDVAFINDRLIYFRRHESAASCNGKGSRFSTARQILFRWKTIKNLITHKS